MPRHAPRHYSATIHIERVGVEIEVELTGQVTPFVPARCSGPPEQCCEAEGGEVINLRATVDGKPFELTGAEEERAADALIEQAGEDDGVGWEYDFEGPPSDPLEYAM